MRILIVTQKIDERDSVLGFMHGWISEFARNSESVVAICLEKGVVNLPENVHVFSLGKEGNESGIMNQELGRKIRYSVRFLKLIFQLRNQYDVVFVHMNPEYVVLGGWFWKLFGKTVTLWYAHKSTPWHLKVAMFFTDIIFTSTKSGFRLESKKVKVVGQGIDTERFKNHESGIMSQELGKEEQKFRIVSVGRITPSKDYETLINALAKNKEEFLGKIIIDIYGPTSSTSDEQYLKNLKSQIVSAGLQNTIDFKGPLANSDLPEVLTKYDLFVNMGRTGSLDKAVPEAMAVGIPVLTCNEAFNDVLGPFKGDLMYPVGDSEALSNRLKYVISMPFSERVELGKKLREIVVRDHSLKSFVQKIISLISAQKNG
jgi:glycosyltransferase involved in cell wall biosynthesis